MSNYDNIDRDTDSLDGIMVGDIVTLRSGGPEMTVNAINADADLLICVWFSQTTPAMAGFAPRALQLKRARFDVERTQKLGKLARLRPIDSDV